MKSKETLEEYEKRVMEGIKLNRMIGNMRLMLNSIGDSNICPFCHSKINLDILKIEYNNLKKEFNKLNLSEKYLDVH